MPNQNSPLFPDSDTLIPDPKVARELGVSAVTLWRWDENPAVDFPPKYKINNRNYRKRSDLDAFIARARVRGRGRRP